MSERKRVKRNVVTTDDISDTGLTKEQFQILSEHYEIHDNIVEDSDTVDPQTPPEKLDGVSLKEIEETIVIKLSKRNGLPPITVRKLLSEYEILKKESV